VPPDETLERIKSGRIYGSTEVALAVLEDLRSEAWRGRRDYSQFLVDYVPKYLAARPTSVAMLNALREFLSQYVDAIRGGAQPSEAVPRIVDSIVAARRAAKVAIAEIGSRRLRDGESVMMHSYSRTAMGIVRRAAENLGLRLSVYLTESRPIGEGLAAAEELSRLGEGVRVRVIVDSAVRYFMKDVDRVIVGADAVAANGAVVNKVGTSVVALAAKEARVNFYVAAETYKFSRGRRGRQRRGGEQGRDLRRGAGRQGGQGQLLRGGGDLQVQPEDHSGGAGADRVQGSRGGRRQ